VKLFAEFSGFIKLRSEHAPKKLEVLHQQHTFQDLKKTFWLGSQPKLVLTIPGQPGVEREAVSLSTDPYDCYATEPGF